MVPETPQAHVEVEQFINEQKPDVVVYDVPMPHGSSWGVLDVHSRDAVPAITTLRDHHTQQRKLEQVVGRTSAVEIAGQPQDPRRLLKGG